MLRVVWAKREDRVLRGIPYFTGGPPIGRLNLYTPQITQRWQRLFETERTIYISEVKLIYTPITGGVHFDLRLIQQAKAPNG